jgi:Kdo2-lipid IVA lauroyltransferase/acyltransferase
VSSIWRQIRYRAEWLFIRGMARGVPLFPRWMCLAVANVVGRIASVLHWAGRREALSNLESVFGDRYSPAERRRLVRQSYEHFSRAMSDLFWSPRLTRENLRDIFDLTEVDRLKAEQGTNRGMIFACMHYGGFEWIALALGLSGFRCTVVTQGFRNPLLNETFNQLRELGGHQTIRRERALLRLYKALLNQRSVTFAVDLTISPKLPAVPITCFGLPRPVTFAHAWLHERTGAPIIPTHCEPLPHGRYRLVLHPPLRPDEGATPQQIAQACWDAFEPVIRANPAPWLWMYKHWRYLPPDADERYPAYAHESFHFRRLLERTALENATAAALRASDAAA